MTQANCDEKAPLRADGRELACKYRLRRRFPFLSTKRGVAVLVVVPLILLSGLSGLAALGGDSSGKGRSVRKGDHVITDDSYFYGESPPVYPSLDMTGAGDWAVAFRKARDLVSNMTIEEKVSLATGAAEDNACSGNIPAVERLGFPGMCLSDAGNGLRATDFVSSFPSGIHVGASWNKELARERAAAMGGEFKAKGVNMLLGPVVGPMGRTVRSGRNWEGFSIDPYLCGSLAGETVRGVQANGVITSTKHFILNEQETYRMPSGDVSAVSSNVEDKTMHELYLWPFQDAVKAGTGNIMCSYQRLNNSYGCANSKILNGLLKTELGFQGSVVSDWGGQRAGVATALSGMDIAMPDGGEFWGGALVEAVKNGSVPESRVTDMATRILTSWYQFSQDTDIPEPGFGMPSTVTGRHNIVDARDPAARSIIRQGAEEGHVLVKNTKQTLPLKSPKMLSIFGYSVKSPDVFAPSGGSIGSYSWSFGAEAGDPQSLIRGFAADWQGATTQFPGIATHGTLINGGGSSATTPALFVSPFEALQMRAAGDGTAVFHDFLSGEPLVDPASDACLVFGNAWASESYDRPHLRDDYTDGLVRSVANQCSKTIVVFHNAGIRLVDQIADHPNVSAIIFAHLPGQDSGPALVSLLYGDATPSGKLPYTVARNESDYGGAMLNPALPEGKFKYFPQADFDEGVYVDYRHFDSKDISPRYEFGFGLSYTAFKFSNLTITPVDGANTDEWPTGAIAPGGQADLWATLALVTATITNTGTHFSGAEVAQLYVQQPPSASSSARRQRQRQLRGFEKRFLAPGTEATVTFALTRRDLSAWDAGAQKWRLRKGEYGVSVGSSSRELPLEGGLVI